MMLTSDTECEYIVLKFPVFFIINTSAEAASRKHKAATRPLKHSFDYRGRNFISYYFVSVRSPLIKQSRVESANVAPMRIGRDHIH